MNAFDVLGDPVRRRIVEELRNREMTSGEVVELVQAEYSISQAGVSQHLKVLRDAGFAQVRVDGARRIYSLDVAPLQEMDAWLSNFRQFWESKLDDLAGEIARGKRERNVAKPSTSGGFGERRDIAS